MKHVVHLLTLQEVARCGITASANIAYQPEPRFSGKVCNLPNYQTCVGLYDSWPGNTVEFYTWYEVREVPAWCVSEDEIFTVLQQTVTIKQFLYRVGFPVLTMVKDIAGMTSPGAGILE